MTARENPLVQAVLDEAERLGTPTVGRYILEAEQAKDVLRSLGFGVTGTSLLHTVQEAAAYIREKQHPRRD